MYDVIIIGKGPAGISASLYTVRAGLQTLAIGSESEALSLAEFIENYYGFETGVSGRELFEAGLKQTERLGTKLIDAEVTRIDKENTFRVLTDEEIYESKAVLLATGKKRRKPRISNLHEYEGRGVSFCSVCDGFFYRGKSVGVIGNGPYALSEINELKNIVNNIILFTMGEPEIEVPLGIRLVKDGIKSIFGESRVEGIELENSERISLDGIFLAVGTADATDLALKLGVITEKNNILVDQGGRTNIEGLFAAGDCTGGLLQVSAAVGEGAKAAQSIIDYVRKNK